MASSFKCRNGTTHEMLVLEVSSAHQMLVNDNSFDYRLLLDKQVITYKIRETLSKFPDSCTFGSDQWLDLVNRENGYKCVGKIETMGYRKNTLRIVIHYKAHRSKSCCHSKTKDILREEETGSAPVAKSSPLREELYQ